MIVLLNGDCICGTRARLRDRLVVRLRAARIDQELSEGASPESTVALALRAQRLAAPESRRKLARDLEGIAAHADPGVELRPLRISLCRARIREAAAELGAVSDRLLSSGPVAARGVAKLEVLLADGCGPLYQQRSREDLRVRLTEVLEALEPLTF
ncbi:MAG: hypothetical protein WAL04_14785 [Acidimicrobiales bacterium]|jgi:hypothetical protein